MIVKIRFCNVLCTLFNLAVVSLVKRVLVALFIYFILANVYVCVIGYLLLAIKG